VTTTITLNPIDFRNIERVLGPAPTEGELRFTHDHNIKPGQVQIETDQPDGFETLVLPVREFDPIGGAFLDAVEEYGLDALQAAPGGFVITTDEGSMLVTYADNLAALTAAASMGVPIVDGDGNAIDPAAVLETAEILADASTMLAIAEADDPDTLIDGEPFIHPETITEHGGEG
jgi:hypothetical protein